MNNQGQYGGGGAEYDDPANCTDYYGAPYDHYGSRKSVGSARIVNNGSPEPPLPPPRNHDSSLNDSKESNEISEAECDRDHPRGNYGGKLLNGEPSGMLLVDVTTNEKINATERIINFWLLFVCGTENDEGEWRRIRSQFLFWVFREPFEISTQRIGISFPQMEVSWIWIPF